MSGIYSSIIYNFHKEVKVDKPEQKAIEVITVQPSCLNLPTPPAVYKHGAVLKWTVDSWLG